MNEALNELERLKGLHCLSEKDYDYIVKTLKAFEIIKQRECVFKGLSETTQEELEFLLEVLEK